VAKIGQQRPFAFKLRHYQLPNSGLHVMISAGISRCWSRAASLSCCDCRDVAGQDDLTAAKLIAAMLTLRWTLPAKRACVVITDTEP
jgi:hypothetical protein